MKFLEHFIRANFRLTNSKLFISKSALEFLHGSSVDVSLTTQQGHFIAVCELPSRLRSNIGLAKACHYHIERIIYRHERQRSKFGNYVKSDFEMELTRSVSDYKKYFYDFRSYRLSENDSKQKAITLCLMKVIKYFLEKYNSPALLYEVFKNCKEKGEIKCGSAREFYSHVRWLIRRGVFEGILLGKTVSQ